jgi:AcrR family transcriptional regulator
MTETILDVALEVMEEQGVSALNMNEVARRVNMRPQSLSEYFSNKNAVYDALVLRHFAEFVAGDEAAVTQYPAGLERIRAWFQNRIDWAFANPVIYHLLFDAPAPGWEPAAEIRQQQAQARDWTRTFVAELTQAGVIDSGMPVEQTADLLLSIRRGLIAERLGKRHVVEADRFQNLVPAVIHMIENSWAPTATAPGIDRAEGPRGGDASA